MKRFVIPFLFLAVVAATIAFPVYLQHLFVIGLNPYIGPAFVLVILTLPILLLIRGFRIVQSGYTIGRVTPGAWFSLAAIFFLLFGFLPSLFFGMSALDVHLHDTYFVIAHSHIVLLVVLCFGLFSWGYRLFSRVTKRGVTNLAAYLHFWITYITTIVIFTPMHYEAPAGMPRRYMDYSNWVSYRQFSPLMSFIGVLSILCFLSQLLFPISLIYAAFKGRKLQSASKI